MNPEESIDIINRMVSDTRRSVLQQSYVPFLTWGGTSVFVSLLVYFLVKYTGDPDCYFLWYLLPVIGTISTRIMKPRTSLIRTGITTSLRSIWWMLAIVMVCFSVASFLVMFNVLFLILLVLSIGSFVSGAVIAYPFLKYSSIAGFAASALLLVVTGPDQIPIFAATMAVMMIIPGFKMKQDLNNL